MILQKLKSFLGKKRCTLLGVGPMSLNCVDATVELANEFDIPLMIIASRRQVDSQEFGGGYVNNWDTQQFAEYVQKRDTGRNIILARDHGGPWQNNKEINANLDLKAAMDSAKRSYSADIEAGFQVIHIDPSVDIHEKPNVDKVLERVYELYSFCWEKAKALNRNVIFEIGTEEQSGSNNTQEELDYTLNAINQFCKSNNFSSPAFMVIQSGTKVMEMRNVGSFDVPLRVENELAAEIQVPKMIELCNRQNIMMKAHNADYISNESLKWHPKLGIHAINVAPEYGVIESLALVDILKSNGLSKCLDTFLDLAYQSMKWKKWMLKDTLATDQDRAIIAGHYVFSNPEFLAMFSRANSELMKRGIKLDLFLKNKVKKGILRYLHNLRMID